MSQGIYEKAARERLQWLERDVLQLASMLDRQPEFPDEQYDEVLKERGEHVLKTVLALLSSVSMQSYAELFYKSLAEADQHRERLSKTVMQKLYLEAEQAVVALNTLICPECGGLATVVQDSYLHVAPSGYCKHCGYEGQL